MDIFEWIDREGCPSYSCREACLTADPYYSEPSETACSDGDFGESHPCSRMLARIEDGIRDGDFDSICMRAKDGTRIDGHLATGGYLVAAQMEGEVPEGYDFSSVPYWFVPDSADYEPKPFSTVADVYYEFFD